MKEEKKSTISVENHLNKKTTQFTSGFLFNGRLV